MIYNYREASRQDWVPRDGDIVTDDRVQIGCLQRIADATESMAKHYMDLIRERDQYLRWFREEQVARGPNHQTQEGKGHHPMKITFEPKSQPAPPVSEEAPPLHPDTRPGDRILCIEPPDDCGKGHGFGYKPGHVYEVERVSGRAVKCCTGHLDDLWYIGGHYKGRAVNYAPTYAEIEARSGKAKEPTPKRYTAWQLLHGEAPCGLYRAWPDKPTPGPRVFVYDGDDHRCIMVLEGPLAPRKWFGSDADTPFALLDVSPEIVIRAKGDR